MFSNFRAFVIGIHLHFPNSGITRRITKARNFESTKKYRWIRPSYNEPPRTPPLQMSDNSGRNKLIPGCQKVIDVVSNRLSKIHASRGCQSKDSFNRLEIFTIQHNAPYYYSRVLCESIDNQNLFLNVWKASLRFSRPTEFTGKMEIPGVVLTHVDA